MESSFRPEITRTFSLELRDRNVFCRLGRQALECASASSRPSVESDDPAEKNVYRFLAEK